MIHFVGYLSSDPIKIRGKFSISKDRDRERKKKQTKEVLKSIYVFAKKLYFV